MATKKHEFLIVGTWKMNPATVSQAGKLFREIVDRAHARSLRIVVAPPTPFIHELSEYAAGEIALGAQDVSSETDGAHTGDVSVSMLKSIGVKYVIIGHSERRAAGETDEVIAQKVRAAVGGKLQAIVCVGETARDKQGNYFTVVETELSAALAAIDKKDLAHLSIAYEPIWAIGTGVNATPEDVYEMKLFIQKILTDRFGRVAAEKVRVLYGGSVNRTNVEALLGEGRVDGFLVGGASLRASDFGFIIETAKAHARA